MILRMLLAVGIVAAQEDAGIVAAQEEAGIVAAQEEAGIVTAQEEAGVVAAQEEAGIVAVEHDCFQHDKGIIGNPLYKPGTNSNKYKNVATPKDCQVLCQEVEGCAWFNWRKKLCYLKSSQKGTEIGRKGTVTGPKDCPAYLGLGKAGLQTLIELPEGEIEGFTLTSRNGKDFAAFEGVPYGEKPERWRPPTPKKGWEGTLECKQPGEKCLQGVFSADFQYNGTVGSEECLFLNVYSSMDGDGKAGLPVMVWFHGGGLDLDEGSYYRPEFFIDFGVIIVTVNYRLNTLGFLSLGTPGISGNQGIRDMQLSLKWVKSHAQYFGGDAERVTIFGQSGGSWGENFLLASPLSKDLFHGVILESGVVIGGTGIGNIVCDTPEIAVEKTKALARGVNCITEGEEWIAEDVEKCLLNTSPEDIVRFHFEGFLNGKATGTSGNIDNFSEYEPVLPNGIEDLISFELGPQVPVMIGHNSNEGLTFSLAELNDPALLSSYDQIWEEVGFNLAFSYTMDLDLSNFDPCLVTYLKKAKQFYFGDEITGEDIDSFMKLLSDTKFNFGTAELSDLMAPHFPVYRYIHSFQDNTSHSFAGTLGYGTTHGDELQYVWMMPDYGLDEEFYDGWSEEAQRHSARMLELFSNFAKFGQPTVEGGSDTLGDLDWEAYNPSDPKYLFMDVEMIVGVDDDLQSRVDFWKKTFANGC